MQNSDDTWLEIKGPDDYNSPNFIKFEEGIITCYKLGSDPDDNLTIIKQDYREKNPIKIENVTNNRIRFTVTGRQTSFYNDRESETKDIIIKKDYQRLVPTDSHINDREAATISYNLNWNKKHLEIVFNTILDKPIIQEINKRLGNEGRKILLERLNETLFLSFYENGYRDKVLPISKITNDSITVYGFPEEPFEVTGYLIYP